MPSQLLIEVAGLEALAHETGWTDREHRQIKGETGQKKGKMEGPREREGAHVESSALFMR